MSAASCSAAACVGPAAPADGTGVGAAGLGRRTAFAVAALRDDINLVSLLHHLVAPQLELAVGDAFAGLDVVFVAVPRAHEMRFGVGEIQTLGRLVRHDPLFHRRDDHALAGRSALVQAIIAVGVEFAAILEDADLGIADEHDPAVAILEFRGFPNKLFGHERIYLPSRNERFRAGLAGVNADARYYVSL